MLEKFKCHSAQRLLMTGDAISDSWCGSCIWCGDCGQLESIPPASIKHKPIANRRKIGRRGWRWLGHKLHLRRFRVRWRGLGQMEALSGLVDPSE